MIPPKFKTPRDMAPHLAKVFAGEYDCADGFTETREVVVVDIGANVGAFVWWASLRWPNCEIHAYEPNPRALRLLRHNAENVIGRKPTIYDAAVTSRDCGNVPLYQGANNLGEASLRADIAGQSADFVEVPTVPVAKLPECDVLKLDCEGNEPNLIDDYLSTHDAPHLVLAEYHSPADHRAMQAVAQAWHYRIVKVDEAGFGRGVVCMRKDMANA